MKLGYQHVLLALLTRVADRGEQRVAVFLSDEVARWPVDALEILTRTRLLRELPLSDTITCEGCEERCRRDVDILLDDDGQASSASWTCHLPTGIGPFNGPLVPLRRWSSDRRMVSEFIARQLALVLREHDPQWRRVRYSTLRLDGAIRAISVEFNGEPTLKVGSSTLALHEVFDWRATSIAVDRHALSATMVRSEDAQVGGKRSQSSSAIRDDNMLATTRRNRRLQQRVEALARQHPTLNKQQLVKKIVRNGSNEGVSASRVVRVTHMPKKSRRKKSASSPET